MGNKDKKPHDPGEGAPEKSPAVQELRRRLAEPGPWPQRFRRLAEAIAGAPNLSCQECEDLLDLYVDAELRGRPVQEMYPSIWQHLHVCPQCRQAHDLLAETLNLERRGESRAISDLGRMRRIEHPTASQIAGDRNVRKPEAG